MAPGIASRGTSGGFWRRSGGVPRAGGAARGTYDEYGNFVPPGSDDGTSYAGGLPATAPTETYAPPRRGTIAFNPDADPARMADNDRARAWNQGDIFEGDFGDEWAQNRNLAELYRRGGDNAYGDLAGTPGFTGDEQDRIALEAELKGYQDVD